MNIDFWKELFRTRRLTLLLLGALLLADAGLYGYLTLYQDARIASMEREWSEASRSGGEKRDRAAIYQQGLKDLATWRGRIASKNDFVRFIGSLLETASANTLTMSGISYKPTIEKGDNLVSFAIQFSVTGRYGAIKSFISDLERARDMMTIDSILLSRPSATDEIVEMKVHLTAYFRSEGA